MSSTFMKEESKDLFYGQFENVKSEKLEYVYESVPITLVPDSVQGDHIPLTLSIDYAPREATSSEMFVEKRFDCNLCDKSFKYKHGLTDHMKRKHEGSSVVVDFGCNYCHKSFASSAALHRHTLTHTNQEIPCRKEGCTQVFSSESDMRQHIEQEHLDKKYTCRVCSKMFTRVSNLNRHMKLHQNIREYPCTLCGKEFTQRVHRDKHMMIHFRTSNQCPKCSAVYTKLKYFNNHVTNVCFSHNNVYNPPTFVPEKIITPIKPPIPETVPVPYTPTLYPVPTTIPFPPTNYTMMCPICMAFQRDLKQLRGHIINVHHVDNICPQCNTKHDDFNEFVKHLRECYVEDKETSTMLTDFANSLLDSFQLQ